MSEWSLGPTVIRDDEPSKGTEIEAALRRTRVTVRPGMSSEEIGQQIVDQIRAQGVHVDALMEAFFKMPIVCTNYKLQGVVGPNDDGTNGK